MKTHNDNRKPPLVSGAVALALTLVFASGPLLAQAAPQDEIVRKLTREGYARIQVTRTLLGRVRILAEEDGRRREIVVDPSSGEILRDYVSDEEKDRKEGGLFGWLFGGNDDEGAPAGDGMQAGSEAQHRETDDDHGPQGAGAGAGQDSGSQDGAAGGDGPGDDNGEHGDGGGHGGDSPEGGGDQGGDDGGGHDGGNDGPGDGGHGDGGDHGGKDD